MAPRQRFIHPEIWDDPDLGHVSPLAFILYVGCFSNADDEGRLIGNTANLKSQVFRYRPEVTVEDVASARDELASACNNFVVYEKNGIEYVCFTNWDKYQSPRYRKASKLPPPPGWKRPKQPKTDRNLDATVAATFDASTTATVASTLAAPGSGSSSGSGSTSKAEERPLQTGAESTSANGLPFEQEILTSKILAHIGSHADEGTPQVVRKYATHLPAATLAKVLESSTVAKPANRAAYIVGALKAELPPPAAPLAGRTPESQHSHQKAPAPPPPKGAPA